MGVEVDTSELEEFGRKLEKLSNSVSATSMVKILADEWVRVSAGTAPVDTGQLRDRIEVRSITGGKSRAEAEVVADVPYAMYVEYGYRHHISGKQIPPNPFFDRGYLAADKMARAAGGRLSVEIMRALESGGVWNPRRVFK